MVQEYQKAFKMRLLLILGLIITILEHRIHQCFWKWNSQEYKNSKYTVKKASKEIRFMKDLITKYKSYRIRSLNHFMHKSDGKMNWKEMLILDRKLVGCQYGRSVLAASDLYAPFAHSTCNFYFFQTNFRIGDWSGADFDYYFSSICFIKINFIFTIQRNIWLVS